MKKTILVAVFAMILVSGCATYLTEKEQEEAIFYATQNAQFGVVPPPKYQTLGAQYGLMLTSTPQPTATQNPNWTPTPNAFQYAQTADAMVQSNQMTQQAQQYQYEMQKAEAERQVIAARETAQVHSMNMTAFAQATQVQSTAFAQGTQVMATAYAQGTATQFAWVVNSQASATSMAITQAVAPTHDMLTMRAAMIQQTVEAGEAEKVELAVRRQEAKNYFDAFLPWVLIVALAYVGARGFQTYVKTRVHARDEHGRQPLLQRELRDGGVVYVKPEQLESGMMKVTADGEVVRYAPMDAQEQKDINKRNAFVDGIAALPDMMAQQGPKLLMNGFQQSSPRVNFRMDMSMNPVVNEADEKLLGGNDEQ
ncbi:hypothetical protein FBQ81_03385 [Chloroflexi bacterium CFX6]|nr:hypothetical protein [Chloroflexi bacterium CFX6]